MLLLIFLIIILVLQIPGFAEDKKEMIKEKASDLWITIKIKAALINDKRIKSRYMDIDTVDGVVTLSGAVKSQEERELALNTVTSIKGANEIRDALLIYEKLGEPCAHTRYSDQANDALITTKIKIILTASQIESLKTLEVTNVDTCNGVAIVIGKARSEREKELAIKSVERMQGINQVVDLIAILPLEV